MNRRLVITGVTGEKSGAAFVRQLHSHRTDIRAAFPGGIRALVRPSSCTDYLKQMLPDVEIFVGEFVRSELLDQALAGTDTVVHNAGIQTSLPIVEAAARCHVRRAILVHTTGIYSKYKQAGEGYREIDADVARICRDHNISLTILRSDHDLWHAVGSECIAIHSHGGSSSLDACHSRRKVLAATGLV